MRFSIVLYPFDVLLIFLNPHFSKPSFFFVFKFLVQYILTHPGTPCVFYDHLFHEQHAAHIIKRLVALRKKAGIHCRSKVKILAASHDVYAAEIDEKIVMKIGPGDFVADAQEYQIADCGHAWAVWEKKECSTS